MTKLTQADVPAHGERVCAPERWPFFQVDLPAAGDPVAALFAEELGLLLEVAPVHEAQVLKAYADAGVPAAAIGAVAADAGVSIAIGGQQHIFGSLHSQTRL